jgi:hypothetical protein
MASDDPEAAANALIGRVAEILNEAHALVRELELPNSATGRTAHAEAQRVLYFALVSALEVGLFRAIEDVLKVLRQASQPLGPMGAEWLERQARAMKQEDR